MAPMQRRRIKMMARLIGLEVQDVREQAVSADFNLST